jgi:DNA-binding transcriptional MerR regulator
LTAPGWVFTERDVVRLLDLTPRRADQLRRLRLLHAPGRSDQYSFRDLVALRVARTLLDQGVTVRQIRRALESLRRLAPGSETPLAELRVTVRDGEIFIERDSRLLEPSGQIVMEFS